jgi:Domain of unknown function (DUF4265)
MRYEQLFARRLGPHRFEVCCIPFFLRNIALGDVVETGTGTDREFEVARVVEPSGRWVFRVWFGESFQPRDEVELQLVASGALLEWYSNNLLEVDVENEQLAQEVASLLEDRQQAGLLYYDTGKS